MLIHIFYKKMVSLLCVFACDILKKLFVKMLTHILYIEMASHQCEFASIYLNCT